MIISEKVKVKINSNNFNHFKKFGYDIKCGQEIEVLIEQLSKGSHALIKVKCDICNKEKFIKYKDYLKSCKYNYYSCSQKCAYGKNIKTCLEKYGVENVNQSEIVKNKIIETCLKKYNVKYYLQTDEKKEKTEKTNIEKYGFKSHNQSNIIKERKKEIILEKYGVENISKIQNIKDKKIQTCLKNYNVENPSKSDIVKKKMEKTNIQKYNYKSPLQNIKILEKLQNTNIKKYGYKNPLQNDIIKEKSRQTYLEKYETEYYNQSQIYRDNYKKDFFDKYGRYVVEIDRWFPSSKLCNVCGYKKDDLTLKDREWICPTCGTNHDRDFNAAINIENEGNRLLINKIGSRSTELTLVEIKSVDPQ